MPAYSTHYIFAWELKEPIEELVDFELNEAALYIGTQGPDIFFDHRVLPWMPGKSLRKIGSLLHRAKPSDIFDKMREYIDVSGNKDIAKSYAVGFILHYALDRNCHPYVYFLQNKALTEKPNLNSHTVHNTIEFAMDTYLLVKRLKIKKAHLFETEHTITFNENELDEIGKMISYVASRVTGKKVTLKDAKTAIKDIKYIQKLTTDKSGKKQKVINIVDNIIAPFSNNFKFGAMLRPKDLENAKKYGNIERKTWISPFDRIKRNDSFEDLFDFAKYDAITMIAEFFDGVNTYDITQNKSFLTGVEVK